MASSDRSAPAVWSLNPMEIIDISLKERTISEDKFLFGRGHRVTLQAIYEALPDIWTSKFNVWTGRISSKPVVCITD